MPPVVVNWRHFLYMRRPSGLLFAPVCCGNVCCGNGKSLQAFSSHRHQFPQPSAAMWPSPDVTLLTHRYATRPLLPHLARGLQSRQEFRGTPIPLAAPRLVHLPEVPRRALQAVLKELPRPLRRPLDQNVNVLRHHDKAQYLHVEPALAVEPTPQDRAAGFIVAEDRQEAGDAGGDEVCTAVEEGVAKALVSHPLPALRRADGGN